MNPAPEAMGTSVMGPLLAFAAIVALIPVALWLLKRTPLGAAQGSNSAMRVVATLPLAPNQRVVTVEVGSGDDKRWLVLGVTPGGISTLHTLPPQPLVAGAATGPMAPFAQLLARQRSTAPKGSNDAG